MDKWREESACDNVDELARSLPDGLWINLLVRDIERAIKFQTEVFDAERIYADASFAIVRFKSSSWMLHADETYANHPLAAHLSPMSQRGLGCEIRLQGCDPDLAASKTLAAGGEILEPPLNKPHNLRETFILDPDSYLWVPSIVTPGDQNG